MEAGKQLFVPLMACHLQELMADMELYGWELVRAFHAIWLQQLENRHVKWDAVEEKM